MKKPSVQSLSGSRSDAVKGWHPEQIKAAVRMTGISLTDLALENGFNEAFLRNTLQRPNLNGEKLIAKRIGVAPSELWPNRYDSDGNPDYAKWRLLRDAELRRPMTLHRRRAG